MRFGRLFLESIPGQECVGEDSELPRDAKAEGRAVDRAVLTSRYAS